MLERGKKILILVESPHKAKVISKIVKDAGFLHTRVQASVGHIVSLKDGNRKAFNSGIYPDDSFRMNLQVAEDKTKLVEEIKTNVKWADIVVIMSDPDREGNVIGDSLIKFAKIPKSKCQRSVVHEITPRAVLHALDNPVPLDESVVEAGYTRMCVDKFIGYALSPLGKKFVGARSIGRCQSVGLMLVSDRENEILKFVPETYYQLVLNFSKEGQDFKAKHYKHKTENIDRFSNMHELDTIMYDCAKSPFIIEDKIVKARQESPKPPFCTATFQQEAANKLGLKVKDAMSCVQRLYEAGLCTYIRTDDTAMSPDFIDELKAYVIDNYGVTSYVGPRTSKKSDSTQAGHECLRCCDVTMTPEKAAQKISNDLQRKVYNLIWYRTVACCLPNAVFADTKYNIKNGDHYFTFTQSELKEPGYKRVYGKIENQNAHAVTCSFDKLETLQNTTLTPQCKQTTPPARFTEATLVKTLQELEIGRPSTFASIVETVLSPARGYAIIENKEIVPTERGMLLADFCKRSFSDLININYTRQLEQSLDKIASGELSRLDYLTAFYSDLTKAIAANQFDVADEHPKKICPECGKEMVVRRSRFGRLFYGCSQFPACRGVVNMS